MLDILECKRLTKKELKEFINLGLPYLKEMEPKNNWDFFVNDLPFKIYCNILFYKSVELSNHKDIFYDKHSNYPKINDIHIFWDMVTIDDFFIEEETRLRNQECITIWELIYNKLNNYIEELF